MGKNIEYRTEVIEYLEMSGIETRPIVTGNVARHPVAGLFRDTFNGDFPGANHVHDLGFYVGLSPMMVEDHIDKLIYFFQQFTSRYI